MTHDCVYLFDASGQYLRRVTRHNGTAFDTRSIVFRRGKRWCVYSWSHSIGLYVHQALAFRWLDGDEPLMFPTLTAAKAYLALAGETACDDL